MTSTFKGWLGAATLVASIACACSTPTRVTGEWRDPSATGSPSIMNVAVIGTGVSAEQRHALEDQFVSALASEGIRAAPSYRVLGSALPDRNTAREMLESAGYDSALEVRLEEVRGHTHHMAGASPGPYANAPQAYGTLGSVRDPGYWVTDKVMTVKTSLWDLREGRPVWAATARTENPSSNTDFAKSLSEEVVPKLTETGLVVKTGK